MRILRTISLPALVLSFAACGGGLDVTTDWDPGIDFSAYETFFVLEEPATGGVEIDGLMRSRLLSAMSSTMAAKGLRQVNDTSQADIAIGWQVTAENRTSYQTVNTGWGGYGWGGYGGWYGGGMNMGMSTTTERNYTIGTLLLAIFDVSREQMVFTGSGTKQVSGGDISPEEAQQRINDIVAQILRDYPPGG